jgi:uncharacterized protein YbaR (Trm112 family)
MSRRRRDHALDAQIVACPKCNAQLMLRRSRVPRIDESGFESYNLECEACGTALSGIVDPYDDMLLVSETAG